MKEYFKKQTKMKTCNKCGEENSVKATRCIYCDNRIFKINK